MTDNIMNTSEVRLRLRELRGKLYLTISDFAKKLGYSMGYIGSVERGTYQFTDELLDKICNTYHVNPKWLIEGEANATMFTDMEFVPQNPPEKKSRKNATRDSVKVPPQVDSGVRLRLRELRRKMRLTIGDFAQKLGYSMGYVGNVERGIYQSSDELLDKVCTTFHVNPKWLGDGEADAQMFTDAQFVPEPLPEKVTTKKAPVESLQIGPDARLRLRELRRKLHMSIGDFAQQLGYSMGYVGNVERGTYQFSEEVVRRVCQTYHVSQKWLVEGDANVPIFTDEEFAAEVALKEKKLQEATSSSQNESHRKVPEACSRIRELREKLNVSMKFMGQKTGHTGGFIGRIEREVYIPRVNFLMSVCDAFHVNPKWLVRGETDAPMFTDLAYDPTGERIVPLTEEPGSKPGTWQNIGKKGTLKVSDARFRLRELRKKLVLTEGTLALRSGYSVGHIKNIEKGLCAPTVKMLMAVCNAFHVNPKWLIDGDAYAPLFSAALSGTTKKEEALPAASADSLSAKSESSENPQGDGEILEFLKGHPDWRKKIQEAMALEKGGENPIDKTIATTPIQRKSYMGTEIKFQLPNGVPLEMIYIEKGSFTMGSPKSELGRFSDEDAHQVSLTHAICIGKYQITQAQWDAVMGTRNATDLNRRNPVTNVSWNDAKLFCARLNTIIQKDEILQDWSQNQGVDLSSFRFDLPTEAQWEYACRAGTATALNSGKNITHTSSCPHMDEVGWYGANSKDSVQSVGKKLANAWGLYDMHGNVWEWCLDWYSNDYYGKSPINNPTGPIKGIAHVLRGGSWGSGASACRSAGRNYDEPQNAQASIGFRLAFSPKV